MFKKMFHHRPNACEVFIFLLYIVEIKSYPSHYDEDAWNYSTSKTKKYRCTKTLALANAFLYKLVSQLFERDFFQKEFLAERVG